MDVYIWRVITVGNQVSLQPVRLSIKLESLDHASEYIPEGAFTTLRTYHGNKLMPLEMHFHRLEQSASLIGQSLTLDRDLLREALRQVIRQLPKGQNVRLRLTLDLQEQPGTVYVAAEALHAPTPQAYQQGVKVITCEFQRRLPTAKLTEFIAQANRIRSQLSGDVNEAIMLGPQGDLLEGLSSNFFAVKKGEVWTAAEGVLAGTTRSLVQATIYDLGLLLHLQAVARSDIPGLQEAFITSSSRGVLPVVQMDQTLVGSGTPGEITRLVMAGYRQRIDNLLEVI